MRLKDLEQYNPITIQSHDNPDADSMAAGFGLYCYFRDLGKDVRFVYSGKNRIKKTNLLLIQEKLNIPIRYLKRAVSKEKNEIKKIPGLLITVDCQYGAGNVTTFEADQIAVIDHHQLEIMETEYCMIRPELGSCSTLVWSLLTQEDFQLEENINLQTALYYGLFTDTNQFSEIYNPMDMDMRDSLKVNKSLIHLFKNSNISRKELETAGVALIRNIYNDDHKYAIIKSEPCDPNILGIISDFLLQVDCINTCVVYTETLNGIKFSVRSCVREVRANELAKFLCENMGNGGGHQEKAGGFINKKGYELAYPTLHSEAYFSKKLNDYFDLTEILIGTEIHLPIQHMKTYRKKPLPMGYVKASDLYPVGTPLTIRTSEGDLEMTVCDNSYIMIGISGEIYHNSSDNFDFHYLVTGESYNVTLHSKHSEYIPTIRSRSDGTVTHLEPYVKVCIPAGDHFIYAKPIGHRVKLFQNMESESYMLGEEQDYIAVKSDDPHDIFIVKEDLFQELYDEIMLDEERFEES